MASRLFGTNGVRGVVNEDLTADFALQMGKAIGTVIRGTIAIATDTRGSGDMIRMAVSSGIMAAGFDVIDIGMVPTPALQHYVKVNDDIMGGVMITASHNPPQFNGIKCIARDGTEAGREQEITIEEAFGKEFPHAVWNKVGSMHKEVSAGEDYIESVLSNVDVDLIRSAKLKVCLDCANGASVRTTPLMLKKLGVTAITLNSDPQGEFPGHPSEPTEENLKDLIHLVKSTKSNLGIAHDGDADRCVFISGDGKFVSGDKSLALLAKYVLSERPGLVITPVSSSSLVEEVVVNSGGTIAYTAVGSPVVARKMIESGAVFGGEENGGLIFPDQQYCRDGAMTAAMMLECIAKQGSLANMVSKLPVYYTEKLKVPCPDEIKKHVTDYLERASSGAQIDRTDGLKLIFPDGWVLVRPSGTEPVFRIYSESKDEAVAKTRAEKYYLLVMEFLDPDGVHIPSEKKPNKRTTRKSVS